MGDDLTVEILRQIRDGISAMRVDFNQRLDALREDFDQRLDQTNQRLDQTNQRLERVEQGLLDLGQFIRQIALDQAKHERLHAEHVRQLEADMLQIKERVQRLEERLGPP
jgi:cob(I)alamin adenosyltransferase